MKLFYALLCLGFLWSGCQKERNATPAKAIGETKDPTLITKEEARDTLRINPDGALKAIQVVQKSRDESAFQSHDLSKLFEGQIPDNGFYGKNRYRIEFIFTDVAKDEVNPALYHVKGKNRYKKTITRFSGTMTFESLEEWKDPNLNPEFLEKGDKIMRAMGKFTLNEDSALASSGMFSGKIGIDFLEKADQSIELWHFSESSPLKGAGYKFNGNWTSFKNPENPKPVVWARDFFSFANEILKDFSIGERDVEINPKYRNLGWDEFWSGEEWWNETPPSI